MFSNVAVSRDLQYGTAPDSQGNPVALRLDLYAPTGDTQADRPALVWVHGGGFSGGDKTNTVPVDVGQTFAKQGYVVVSINYRLLGSGCVANPGAPQCTIAAIEAQHDAQAAIRWLRARAGFLGIDPTRIGIGGESAGAHHRDAGRPELRRSRAAAATPASRRPCAASRRSPAGCRPATSRTPATRPACSSTAPPTRSCRRAGPT